MCKLVVLSDIHANLNAFTSVIKHIRQSYQPDYMILLGDIINYGMRPNEVISEIKKMEIPIVCNLAGNHEKALLDGDLNRFSTERGKQILKYTSKILSPVSLSYIKDELNIGAMQSLNLGGKRLLCLHGDIDNPYWGKLTVDKMKDERYAAYDYVLFGHTHIPNYTESFFKSENIQLRNRKKTVFLNPGSVGQPRNQNSSAQYLYMDLESGIIHHNAISYNILEEQSFFPQDLDQFYKERLMSGI